MSMPIGVDPVAEMKEIHAARRANLNYRIEHARTQFQMHRDPYERKLNSPLVSGLLNAVVNGRRPNSFDNDFDRDEISGLYDTAMTMYHENGKERGEVFELLLVLVGSMREMKHQPTFNLEVEAEPDGELIDEDIAL